MSAHDEIMARMAANMPEGLELELPPKVFVDMGAEMRRFEDQTLVVRFPVLERYQNPMGFMQGGVLSALIDNTMGPLSFLVAPPSVTSTLTTTFIRPVLPIDAWVEVTARVVERTSRQLIMDAEVVNPAGKRIAVAHAIAVIL